MKSAKNNEKEILLYLYTSIFKNRGGQKEVLSSPPTSSLPYFPKVTQKPIGKGGNIHPPSVDKQVEFILEFTKLPKGKIHPPLVDNQ